MNFIKRTLTALILLPLLYISVQYLSDPLFFGIIQAVLLTALIEFYQLPRKKFIFPDRVLGVIIALILGASFIFPEWTLEAALLCSLAAAIIYFVITTRTLEKLMAYPVSAALTFFGAVYLSFTLNHIFWLRKDFGPVIIYFVLVVVFVGDTGAYLIGKFWGRRKLAPLTSPKKTWEGSAAGILTGIMGGLGMQQIFIPELMSPSAAVFYSAVIQIVAQFSDLGESMFKRASGVKDSSHLLPGHGGFLDRIDSLILVLPVFYYLLKYSGIS